MNVTVGYGNNVEICVTHPNSLPKDDNLETTGIWRSMVPSRSMLGNATNRGMTGNQSPGLRWHVVK